MNSLIKALAKAGKKPPFSIKAGFQTQPGSLKEIIRILNLPEPVLKNLQYKKLCQFREDNPQGLTYGDGNVWFLANERKIIKFQISGPDLYNPSEIERLESVRLADLIRVTPFDINEFDHIGDIAFQNGLIFTPIRRTGKEPPHLLLALSKNLEVVGYSQLPEHTKDSWCAINPWNGLLYMPHHNRQDYLNAFDVSAYQQRLSEPDKWGESVDINFLSNKQFHLYNRDGQPDTPDDGFQGIAFSPNGRLYATNWVDKDQFGPLEFRFENYIYVYNSLTGLRHDISPDYNFDGAGDEIEGVSIHPSGMMYITVADNGIGGFLGGIIGDYDEFHLLAFQYSDTTFPV